MRIHSRLFSLGAVAVLAGCSTQTNAPSSDPVSSIHTATDCDTSALEDCGGGTGGDGYGLAGRTLNGTTLDGLDLDGHGLLGVAFSGARTASGRNANLGLQGSTLTANANSIIGTTLQGELDTGGSLPLLITGAAQAEGPDLDDVMLYSVSYQTTSGWVPFCGQNTDGSAIQAIALSGRWNYATGVAGGGAHINDSSSFTWACVGYALEKCTELGYKPWDSAWTCDDQNGCQPVSLAPTHEACTRAIRADYCGDGVSYTVDGTLIDIYDSFGLRASSPGWPFEAEWTAAGARCAVRERNPELGTPACWSSLQKASCGSPEDWQRGALVMTQDSPPSP